MAFDASTTITVINAASSLFLAGVIWIVQLVHYPFLQYSDPPAFRRAHRFHMSAITPVVAPMMILELATSVWIAVFPPTMLSSWITPAGLVLVAFVWVSTFAIQVPAHNLLSEEFSEARVRSLAKGNWLRTAAWTFKSILGIYVLFVLTNRL